MHAFPSGPEAHDACAVPLVYGKYWIPSVGAINGVVVLDASDLDRPDEVSWLSLANSFHGPHCLAADRANGRIAVTGMYDNGFAMLKFDERTGQISLHDKFGKHGSIQFDRPEWPHGSTGKAIVHGAVFSRF